jgi:hypothetical protein
MYFFETQGGVNVGATSPFENVKNQIGYCGIWCGSCLGGNGVIVELTKRFEKEVKKGDLETWVPKDFDFKEFVKGLASIQRMPHCPGCRKGGGKPDCGVRLCASKKGFSYCYECHVLKDCKKFDWFEKSIPKIKEDLVKMQGKDFDKLVTGWLDELKAKWPYCVLLCSSSSEK